MKRRCHAYPEHTWSLCKSCLTRYLIAAGIKTGWPSYKGLSMEERYGRRKAEKIREKLKQQPGYWAGRKLPKSMKNAISAARNGVSFAQLVGESKAAEWRSKISDSLSGTGNPMYGKTAPKGAGRSVCSGHVRGVYFRSFSELCFLLHNPEAKSAEHLSVSYTWNDSARTYHPDFICDSVIYEIKPARMIGLKINCAKFKAARKKWPNFVVQSPGVDFPWSDPCALSSLVDSGDIALTRGSIDSLIPCL